ncbi:MAG: hypothetical protein U1E02_17085, partial [Hydrogenophaga sp.]|nr:hypothetical protein [Hydrogenophaga sp.]
MPLPPAPSKRAALLSPEAYSLKAAEEPFELEADTVPLVPAPVVQPARLPEVTAMTPPPAAKAGGRAVGRSRKPASVANPVVAERSEMAPPLQKAMPAVSTAARSPRPAQVTPSAGSRRRSAGKAGNGPAALRA